MNLVNLLTFASFACALLAGIMVFILQDMRGQQPPSRIRARMHQSFTQHGVSAGAAAGPELDVFRIDRADNAISRWLGPRRARLSTVAGKNGVRLVMGAAVLAEIVALTMAKFMPLPELVKPVIVVVLPVLALGQAYRYLVARFRKRFLDGFPDVIDMIVRAVRAGVPVTQVIGSAAAECREPLRSEFRLMADSLQVGLDLEEVLNVAMHRIEIADFSFFCVCLLLQRETGGQLGETLENLSGIVRTRREIRQKTRALTGEARITTKILAAIPIVIMLSLYAINRSYLMVLFNTESGHKLLTFAVISIVVGMIVIGKISKLDTSR